MSEKVKSYVIRAVWTAIQAAAAAAIAIPDTVFITRIFCARSIDWKEFFKTLIYFWLIS